MSQTPLSRRTFVSMSAAGAGLAALPAGAAPRREALRFAKIACGGMGEGDFNAVFRAGAKPVAFCDVDENRAKKVYEKHPDVPRFTDYRKMLDKVEKEIDAVVVSTPDHTHAAAALDAMRRGKHVYVQKPLARTFHECQSLLESSRKNKLVTQMGNQGHAGGGLKLWEEMAKAEAFGEIRHIHTWSDRPIWAQGMSEAPKEDPVPAGLDWDSWIGPVAMRPFSKRYHPFGWRGWWDFGAGAMGDMACHNMDPAFWIFKLGLPSSVKAEASTPAGVAYPTWSVIEYTFAPTPRLPKGVKLTWHDGKKLPPPPPGSAPNLKIDGNGCMVVGSKLTAMGGSHAGAPHVVAVGESHDDAAVKEAEAHWQGEQKKLKGTDHYAQWVRAAEAKDMTACGSGFEYSVPFTQAILIGCIAIRYPGQELKWDAEKRRFSNHEEANQWLTFEPRKGYSIDP
jgi:predicted dehydrogenase